MSGLRTKKIGVMDANMDAKALSDFVCCLDSIDLQDTARWPTLSNF